MAGKVNVDINILSNLKYQPSLKQSEIHLHPSVQAGLADIFIEVIKTRNIQIIIESHSERLLRRLQRRMAEEKDGFTNNDSNRLIIHEYENKNSKRG